jgi:hypothetical protein
MSEHDGVSGKAWVAIVVAAIAALSPIMVALIQQGVFGSGASVVTGSPAPADTGDTQPPDGSDPAPPPSGTTPSRPTNGGTHAPATTAPSSAGQPALTVSPDVAQVGERFTITGTGFPRFLYVSLEAGGYFVGGNPADAEGNFRYQSLPVVQSDCQLTPLTLEAVVYNPQTFQDEVLAEVTVHLCVAD